MKYLKVFTDFAEAMDALSDAEKGRLFDSMLKYADHQAAPDLRGGERILWPTAKQMIDKEIASYEKLCEKNRENITKRYQGLPKPTKAYQSYQWKQDKDKDNIKEILPKGSTEKAGAFSRPTVEDVQQYCSSSGTEIDATAFVDFYTSKGWKVGSSPMKDWRAAVRNWARKDAERKTTARKKMGANAGYKQTALSDEDFSAMFLDLDHDLEEG